MVITTFTELGQLGWSKNGTVEPHLTIKGRLPHMNATIAAKKVSDRCDHMGTTL